MVKGNVQISRIGEHGSFSIAPSLQSIFHDFAVWNILKYCNPKAFLPFDPIQNN